VATQGGNQGGTSPEMRERIVAATLVSLARYGVAKTTLEDVAKEAGCARATVYRYFGGKPELLLAVVSHEALRILGRLDAAAQARTTLEDAVVAMATAAAHELLEHDALQFVLAHEPELVLPAITFQGCDRFVAGAGAALAPTFARFVGTDEADRAARWCTRVFLTYLGAQDAPVTMTDEVQVRALVRDFVAPALTRAPASQPVRG
jgi:TetR/AcrR family transcriptional regulator, repressor for uid operon